MALSELQKDTFKKGCNNWKGRKKKMGKRINSSVSINISTQCLCVSGRMLVCKDSCVSPLDYKGFRTLYWPLLAEHVDDGTSVLLWLFILLFFFLYVLA